MSAIPEKPTAHIEVSPATPVQEPIMANLLELYAHDFSQFHHLELDDNGRFGYEKLRRYWSEPVHLPLLFKVNGRLAGFALIKRGSEISDNSAVWDVAEFFIVRAHRRQGIGIRLAHELWRRFSGPWEVRVMESNGAALKFWERAITTFNHEAIRPARIQKDDKAWYIFAFECKHAI